jgi:hypothetical protein
MNSNLQYSLAQGHTQHLYRQAANAQRVSAIRSDRHMTFTARLRAARLRTLRLRTHLAGVAVWSHLRPRLPVIRPPRLTA